jgi:hypothetical protein
MPTVWGGFKATGMSGLEDRGDLYRFWYNAVELPSDEMPVDSWKTVRVPIGRIQNFAVVWGNLVLTTGRLIFEPMSSKRAAFGDNGRKLLINTVAGLQDRISPRSSFAVPLTGLRVAAHDEDKHALAVNSPYGSTMEFYFGIPALGFGIRAFGRGDAGIRGQVLARLIAAGARSDSPSREADPTSDGPYPQGT